VSTAPRIFTPEYYERMRGFERVSWWNAGMRDIAAMLLDHAQLPATGTMLDVGCGSGQTMTWFAAAHPNWKCYGLDVAVDGLGAARAFGRSVCRASALTIPFASQSIDLVITLDVLQHLPLGSGDLDALREIYRVLRPGGYLFARTNAQAFPHTTDDHEFNFHKYTVPELRRRLSGTGFTIRRLSRVNAVLGLAEIPRELRARNHGTGYHGILSKPQTQPGWLDHGKLQYLRCEGALVRRGVTLPFGRTIVALCRT
jgi:ubiquinone/menaquinone biosynthesis C-methylase UbiE